MDGIAKFDNQIHIKHKDEIIVLQIDEDSPELFNSEDFEKVYSMLANKGVPTYEASGKIGIARNSRRGGFGNRFFDPFYRDTVSSYRDDYQPRYYGSPIRVYPSDTNY